MRDLGLRGVVRGRRVTDDDRRSRRPSARGTSWSGTSGAARPNSCGSSDLTYVATWRGFVYVAFVIDVFARRIVGWRASSSLRSDLALDALEQALYDATSWTGRSCTTATAGVQYLSIRYTERLAEAGIEPSVGSRGDSYDNALAESRHRALQDRGDPADAGPGAASRTSSSPRSSGWPGSTPSACWNRSATSRRRSTKRSTPGPRRPQPGVGGLN